MAQSLNTLALQNYKAVSGTNNLANKIGSSQEIKILYHLPQNLVEVLKSYPESSTVKAKFTSKILVMI